ncbi:type II toxin-antitoxin system RelE/ParE family toxin [bacterium]|nr:type II toxin-antitoxin system RelE/ParE family toxin [bacterium]
MPTFHLTNTAKQDLINIWQYTFQNWGENQADSYLDLLESSCSNLLIKQETWKALKEIHPNLYSIKCEHHFIFFQLEKPKTPIVLAFLHEKMDMMVRLKNRL